MKIKKCLLLLVVSSILFSACGRENAENTKVENAAPTANKTQNSPISESDSDANAVSNENSAVKANFQNNDSADFEGTAGITDKKNNVKGAALLTKIRTAEHGNYDRVVFEFAGAEMPSYHIEYVDKPVRSCGSGEVVPLKGDGWLEIRFNPANAHTEEGKPTIEKREFAPNHKIIKEIKSTCDFEANVEWVLGVASPNKYRVLELENPTRLAVDIKHK
jgi:hypothetical protein